MDKANRIDQYQKHYLNQYGFETEMVNYRRKLVLERMSVLRPKLVVEVGCGAELLYQHYFQIAGEVERWVIVEPGREFYDIAAASGLPNLLSIQGFFEDVAHQVKSLLPRPPDMVIISSVLHEVASPDKLLGAAKCIMGEQSLLHANVPNATSFHRLLGKSMGLIENIKELGSRNLELMQYRVYDANSLRYEIQAAGFIPVEEGGYFIKPFTHEQMELVAAQIGEAVMDGLYYLGKHLPDLASEIYIEARRIS